MRPIIGITPARNKDYSTYQLQKNYVDAVFNAGGLPQILPFPDNNKGTIINRYIDNIDGLLLSGGIDPDPLLWGEQPIPGMGRIDPLRDNFEIELIKLAKDVGLPILGICRGCQLINVALGGSIIQDFSGENGDFIKHRQEAPHWYPTHTIKIENNTILAKIFAPDQKIKVNSFHHQGVKKPGKGLIISSRAEDDVIEAFEDSTGLIMGVQWHPERMKKESGMHKLFARFVALSESQ